jgi:hypothetical protein
MCHHLCRFLSTRALVSSWRFYRSLITIFILLQTIISYPYVMYNRQTNDHFLGRPRGAGTCELQYYNAAHACCVALPLTHAFPYSSYLTESSRTFPFNQDPGPADLDLWNTLYRQFMLTRLAYPNAFLYQCLGFSYTLAADESPSRNLLNSEVNNLNFRLLTNSRTYL